MLFIDPTTHALSQQLRRRAFLGAEVASKDLHVIVAKVVPSSSAAEAGLLVGDILLRIGTASISDPAEAIAAVRTYRSGDRTVVVVDRNGKQVERTVLFKPVPFETSPDFDVLYKAVVVDGAKYRAVVTKPKRPGRFPGVLLIGGLGCYSLDNLSPNHPYRHILYELTRKGFVTMRVDKSGEGDPPCDSRQSDLHLAVDRSVAGLNALKGYNSVDPNRVFIFAHSIGPIEAAFVVNQVPVRGLIAAETIGKDWLSYDIENVRRQLVLLGEGYEKVESEVRKREGCEVRFYLQKQTPDLLRLEAPQCLEGLLWGTSYTYMQQIGDVNLAQEWKSVDIPVLVIYGTSDPKTSEEESLYLVNMINSFHPGCATYLRVHGMSHGFDKEPSQRDSMLVETGKRKPGNFDASVLTDVQSWMDRVTRR